MARNIECRCEYNFTCGYCLRNAKPWVWTFSTAAEQLARAVELAPIKKDDSRTER